MAQQGLVPGVQFFELIESDLKDPKLTLLNRIFQQIVSCINILTGSQGKLKINVPLDMQGNEIDNAILSAPTIKSPAISGSPTISGATAAGIVLSAAAPTAGQSQVSLGNGTATTATAGADTLPANPAGFLIINVGGSQKKVPFYNP